jgi:hypothetical protein
MEAVARRVLDSVREMVPGRFHTRAASPITHPHVRWKAYDDVQRRLEALGFRYLGDVEPVSMPLDPRMARPAVMRMLVSGDGTVMAGFYQLALRWTPMGILARYLGGAGGMLDLVTIFPDGTIVETSNAEPAGVWSDPPFLRREFVVRTAAVEQVADVHADRVMDKLSGHPGVPPVSVHSLLEVVAATDATERAKRAWRQSIGWVTRDELARLSRLSGPRLDELERAVRTAAAEPG